MSATGLFPPGFIGEVCARTPIVPLISRNVKLVRSGKQWKACCPFHAERSPSFYVYDDHFHCFGCRAHGDAISYAMKRSGLDFAEAVRLLASEAGLAVPGSDVDQAELRRLAERREQEIAAHRTEATPTRQDRGARHYGVRILTEAVPIEGTLAEQNLRHWRGLGDLPLPSEPRFHPAVWSQETKSKHPAIVIPCHDAHGRLARVQAILLDPVTGKKANLEAPKRTFGAGAGHVPASFAAREPDGRVFLVEGPEDAITINAVTGWRADASLGSGSLDKPRYQPGTELIIVGDNGELGHAAAKAAAEAHRARAFPLPSNVTVIFPPEHVKDANELLQQRGADAVRVWLEAALHPAPKGGLPAYYEAPPERRDEALEKQTDAMRSHLDKAVRIQSARREAAQRRAEIIEAAGGEDALSPAQKGAITKRAHQEAAKQAGFGRQIPKPTASMFSGAQGSGKTRMAVEYMAADRSNAIWWLTEPTTAKAEEEYLAYQGLPGAKPPAMIIRGREQVDPKRPGHQMCDRAATATRIAQAGLSVIKNLCTQCPLKPVCGDQRQHKEAADLQGAGEGAVFFLASEYAFVPAPCPKPDHAVLDESLIIPAGQVFTLSLDTVRGLDPHTWGAAGDPDAADKASRVLHGVCDALDTPWSKTPAQVAYLMSLGIAPPLEPMPLAYLRKHHVTEDDIRALASLIDEEIEFRTPTISGEMSDIAIAIALDAAEDGSLRNARSVVSAVLREINKPRDTLTGIVAKKDGSVLISRLRPLVGLANATLTVLDGTGDIGLSRQLFGAQLDHVHTPFPRLAHVTGTIAKGYSRQSITGRNSFGNAIESRQGEAGNLRGDIAKVYASLPSDSLLCGSKQVVEALEVFGSVPTGTAIAHFSALRGMNEWKQCPAGLFVGCERISIEALEDLARAYMADDDAPFVSMAEAAPADWGYRHWPYKATRMRRMRDGSLSPIEVEVHPDPRVQAVHEQIREAELIQGIDRLRSIWNERRIILMNDLCLDVTYDAIYRHKDLVAGGPVAERVFRETGLLPLSSTEAARAFPVAFRNPKAAERALKNYPHFPNNNPIWNCGVVSYRRIGQRGPEAKLLIDPTRHPDPKAAAIALLGPLQSVNGIACEPEAPVAPAPTPDLPVAPNKPQRQPQRPSTPRPRPVPFWEAVPDLPTVPDWVPPAWMVEPCNNHDTDHAEGD